MGTRSTISILDSDDTVTTIYCQLDGYPSYNGRILMFCYPIPREIHKLMAHGDLITLGATIGTKIEVFPPVEQIMNPDRYVAIHGQNVNKQCKFYHRDNENNLDETQARKYRNLDDFMENEPPQQYNYLFKNGRWYFDEDDFSNFIELKPKHI